MAKFADVELGAKWLKDQLKYEGNPIKRDYIKFTMAMFNAMPTQDAVESINCGQCAYYDKKTRHCIHNKGLGGKLDVDMYCSYAAYDFKVSDDDDDEDFSEFDEEE